MKKRIGIFLSSIGLFAVHLAPSQSTLCLSNLGETPGGSVAARHDQWLAGAFSTGNAPGGYGLNSIQLLMNPASGNPSGFTVALYHINGALPGASIVGLTGDDPAAGGVFSYAAPGTILSPYTSYFVVITAVIPVASASYNWSLASTGAYSSSEGWKLAPAYYSSNDGSSWGLTRPFPLQFAIYATAVPEPSVSALAGLGLVGLRFWQHKRRLVRQSAGTESARA